MIKIYNYPKDNIEGIIKKSSLDFSSIKQTIRDIIDNIKKRGDDALFEYTKQFDNIIINKSNIKVSRQEIEEAYEKVNPQQLSAIKNAKKNILQYHLRHKAQDCIINKNGQTTGYLVRPLSKAGIYVPGGTAPYPSSVLMTALPAKAAGVKNIIMCSPNVSHPLTLVAAFECGVTDIYKVG